MGRTPKPLHIQVAATLYQTHQVLWDTLSSQGHTIEVLPEPGPDLVIGPYAMRLTSDTLDTLPGALDILIKGARALRYGPHAKEKGDWKRSKLNATPKKTHKGKTFSS